jgi:hypothetical protein
VLCKAGTVLAVASATTTRACVSASWASTAPCARIRLCSAKPARAAAAVVLAVAKAAAAAAAANQFVVFVVTWELLPVALYLIYVFECCSARRARKERKS